MFLVSEVKPLNNTFDDPALDVIVNQSDTVLRHLLRPHKEQYLYFSLQLSNGESFTIIAF